MSFWALGIGTAHIYVYRHVATGTCAASVSLLLLPYSTSVAVESPLYTPLQIPLPLLADLGTGACAFDLSLPNPEFAVSSLANKLRFISSAISKAAFGKCDEECAASRHAAAVAEAVKSGTDMPLTLVSFSSLRAIHPMNPECCAFFASILFQPSKQQGTLLLPLVVQLPNFQAPDTPGKSPRALHHCAGWCAFLNLPYTDGRA
jgi:hypothetical protein